MIKNVFKVLAVALLIVGIVSILPAETKPQPVRADWSDKYDGDCTGTETAGRCADKPFDHSNCQYPDRTTNPPYGCDNSDPCDPANTKGGSGDCTEPTPTVTPAQPTEAAQCGGK